jgi:hypothetical protein
MAFALRIPDPILQQAQQAAREDGVSVDQILLALITEGIGQRHGVKAMEERAARADIPAALAILDRAPDVPPEPGDERPAR